MNYWRNIVFKPKAYVKVNGTWFEVYQKETWRDVVAYAVVFALACATVGILL